MSSELRTLVILETPVPLPEAARYKQTMALSAIIFDVDGTLIDSNDAHLAAWMAALKQHEYEVSEDRIAVEIGKGGDKLVPSVLGEKIEKRDGKSLRKAQSDEFKKTAKSTRLKMFSGAADLVTELRRRGLKTALCTSSGQGPLDAMRESAGFDWASYFDQIITADDASESKPAPNLLQAAFKKLKLSPAQCVMVGDTPYDADTARDAGASALGVICGKMNDEQTLLASGMRAVYRDPADILAHLDEVLTIASPGSKLLTSDVIESLMHEALSVAREALVHGELPIGSVIARGDGTLIARAHNEVNGQQNKLAHAEMVAFGRIAGKVPLDARDLILVSTLEPCVMCLGAAMQAAVDTILFGLNAPANGGRSRVRPPLSPQAQMPRLVGGVLADESRSLLKDFLAKSPVNPQQQRFVEQLLEQTA